MNQPLFKTKEGSYLRLEWATRPNEVESEKEGRPIHDKVLLGFIMNPGSRDEASRIIERHKPDGSVIQDGDWSKKHADHVNIFKETGEGTAGGTPLSSWPAMDVSTVADMAAMKIYTVEDMAGLSDAGIGKIGMGGRELRTKAIAYLKAAQDSSEAPRLAAENQRLRSDVDRLQAQLESLGAMVEALKGVVAA